MQSGVRMPEFHTRSQREELEMRTVAGSTRASGGATMGITEGSEAPVTRGRELVTNIGEVARIT